MLLPLKDHNPTRRFPFVTVGLIIANVLVFLGELTNREWIFTYGMIPAEVVGLVRKQSEVVSPQISILTSMFLHGSWLHLIFNMWSLWIFGNNVEDALGHLRYLLLYLIWGYLAGWSHILFHWGSTIPTVGASGAIAGVMGAYLLLYPHARIDCMLFYFIITFIEVPAVFFLIFWFVSQFFVYNPGVAYLAHIGGFIAGAATVKLLGGPRQILGYRIYRYYDD